MKFTIKITKLLFLITVLAVTNLTAQDAQGQPAKTTDDNTKGTFSFGTTGGVNFNNGYFSGSISPMLIYNFNKTFGVGVGYNYTKGIKPDSFNTTINGGSAIALMNVSTNFQLSAEFERSNVIIDYDERLKNVDEDFWYSGLFLGAGVTSGNIIVGVRYNVFYDDDDNNVYPTPLVPFVRVLF